jgi:inositol phosphorylceramide mannosyltransferase catalytic subunit
MIPRILHQTAKTADIPPRWQGLQAAARALHPGWEYRLWTDEDNLRLVAGTSAHLLSVYTALPRNIMRADFVRYLILDKCGGMYFDFDYEFFKPFDLLDHHIVLPRESDDDRELYLGNCIMASEPGHPFWTIALEELEKGVAALGREPLEDEITTLTGPGLMTRAYRICLSRGEEMLVPLRGLFHPVTPSNDGEYRALRDAKTSYGVHHCDGTWRATTVAQRIRRKLSRLRTDLGGRSGNS